MSQVIAPEHATVSRLTAVTLKYGKVIALDNINLNIPAGCIVGLIGPDGVGKSSLLALIAGARKLQKGTLETLNGNMASARHRKHVCPHIAYMPQGLGKNLYPTLSVEENLQFFGRLFGHDAAERRRRIDALTTITNLYPFLKRHAGQLSGGMKQKLGLCCALIHSPKLLILDEPTTGVDPLSRNQFWNLITQIRTTHPEISIIVATAYMEEAERFDWLIAMDAGKILATGTPPELRQQTNSQSLEETFIALLPDERKREHTKIIVPPLITAANEEIAIEARDLTKRFNGFTAVDHVNLRIRRGEIFGFLGSNGCGKTTTMKMLTGLLAASEGQAWLFGHKVNSHDIATRRRVGYMSQGFSLYSELTVYQNLLLHARLFNLPKATIQSRIQEVATRFGLTTILDVLPNKLPLGMRQRLSLAVAMVHKPEMLILDEPTSGVDPIARDNFWQLMIDLARKDKITIFISTHFMNEAERCDRISLMHAGKVLVSDAPAALIKNRGVATLEAAFIDYLKDVQTPEELSIATNTPATATPAATISQQPKKLQHYFNAARAFSYTIREALELRHDPARAILALFGSLLLMLIMGYGVTMDVEKLSFAVLDRDQTTLSQNYILNLGGSKYFIEHPPITDYADLDRRMRNGELSLAIEIPPRFARDVQRGKTVQIGAWIDGAMPQRAEVVQGYVQGMHLNWLIDTAKHRLGQNLEMSSANIETRFRYNPDVKSLPAMVPAIIPLLLLMISAILTALSVVREKELGSIINFYVTPITRTEFLLGKQLPYIAFGMLNFLLMVVFSIVVFGVTVKGNFLTLFFATLLFVIFATGFGLFASTFTRSQIASIFFTMLGTMLPVIQFSGLINPVSSLEGIGKIIGQLYPASHFLIITRGVFTKALTFTDLKMSFIPLLLAIPIILGVSILLLKKQER